MLAHQKEQARRKQEEEEDARQAIPIESAEELQAKWAATSQKEVKSPDALAVSAQAKKTRAILEDNISWMEEVEVAAASRQRALNAASPTKQVSRTASPVKQVSRTSRQSIPVGHTSFSWMPPAEQTSIPVGHTSFSWGIHHTHTRDKKIANPVRSAPLASKVQQPASTRRVQPEGQTGNNATSTETCLLTSTLSPEVSVSSQAVLQSSRPRADATKEMPHGNPGATPEELTTKLRFFYSHVNPAKVRADRAMFA